MDSVLIVGVVFYAIYKVIELFVLQSERRMMIRKMSEVSPEMLQNNINSVKVAQKDQSKSNQFLMLRLGGLALGIGAGWLLGMYLNSVQFDISNLTDWNYRTTMSDMMNSTVIASTALCAGIAMIIVYLIERKAYKNIKP